MCGIYGVISLSGRRAPERSWLSAMGNRIVHRGPDDEGGYVDGPCAIGMRRLSIIDVSGGHQPIANEDETLQVVCNGEIYNFRELREELLKKGHRFRTGSDSETVLHLYEEEGDQFVRRLEGMWAFALWDRRRRRLLVGRDRLGIKPLYIARCGDWLAFASEAKSFLALPFFKTALSEEALAEYLHLGYVPGSLSMFRDVSRLPQSSMLIVDGERTSIERYWRLRPQRGRFKSEAEAVTVLRETLDAAVARQMVADVPIGAFLSGGIDSSSVVGLMSRHSDLPIRTYAIGYEGRGAERLYNELPYARDVANHFKTDHHEIIVRPDVVGLLPRLIWHMDEPVADSALVTTYLVSEFAARDVKVILSGVGGDEILGGYKRYLGEFYARQMARVPGWIRRGLLAPVLGALPSDRHSKFSGLVRYARSMLGTSGMAPHDRYQSFLQVCDPQTIRDLRGADAVTSHAVARAYDGAPEGDWLYRMMAADIEGQLCDDLLAMTDRMTMATSIECRVPLLDESLIDLATEIPAEWKIRGSELKSLFKVAVAPMLPESIIRRGKRGFGAPFGAWLRQELAPLLDVLLSPASLGRRGLFAPAAVRALSEEHNAKRADHSDVLLALMLFEIWARIYLDGVTPADVCAEVQEATGVPGAGVGLATAVAR